MKRLMGIFNPYALKRYEALGQRESDGSFVRTQADSSRDWTCKMTVESTTPTRGRNSVTVESPYGLRSFTLVLGDVTEAPDAALVVPTHANVALPLDGKAH